VFQKGSRAVSCLMEVKGRGAVGLKAEFCQAVVRLAELLVLHWAPRQT